jgi:flagellar hook-associated protein 1 FlgK
VEADLGAVVRSNRVMSLEVTLRNAVSGLAVTQKNIEVVSRNVSNGQTEGYTRKIHKQEARDPRIGGVNALDAVRIVDEAMRRDLALQEGKVANFTVREAALGRIEAVNVDPEDELSLSSVFGRLREAFSELSSSPESPALQQAVVSRATTLTETVRRLAAVYEDERDRTETDIAASITKVNNLLQTIANLNDSISTAVKAGRKVPDLEDQRDQTIKSLSEEMDVTVISRQDGTAAVLTSNGRTLVDRTAFSFSFTPTKTDNNTFYPGGGINGIRLGGDDITTEIVGGRIGGYIELRDDTIPQFQAQLDEFAYRMTETFNAQGLRLFGSNAAGAMPGTAPAARIGYSKSITVPDPIKNNPTLVQQGWANGAPATIPTATTRPVGDNTLVTTLLSNVFDTNTVMFATTNLGPNSDVSTMLPPSASLAQFTREIVAYQSNERANLTTLLKGETTYRDSLANKISDQSGVNLDQEVSLLIQLQQTYGANARVITATNRMFEDLLGIIR